MASKTPETNYRKIIEEVAYARSQPISVFQDFVAMAACALSVGTREPEYLEIAERYSKDELIKISHAFGALVMECEAHPFEDRLGTYYLEIAAKSSMDARGEFYTPQSVSDLMAMVTVNAREVIERGQPIAVGEPACGAGGMILSLAKLFAPKAPEEPSYVDLLRVSAQDINRTACDACFVNTTLWGIPAQITWGNTLSMEIWKTWSNIHWHRVGQADLDRMRELVSAFQNVESEAEAQATEPQTMEQESKITLPADPSSERFEQMDLL